MRGGGDAADLVDRASLGQVDAADDRGGRAGDDDVEVAERDGDDRTLGEGTGHVGSIVGSVHKVSLNLGCLHTVDCNAGGPGRLCRTAQTPLGLPTSPVRGIRRGVA